MTLPITEILLALGSLALANLGTKLGRAYPLLKKALALAQGQVDVRKDGKITQAEKARLYDDIEALMKEAYGILKGLFPNKSK